MAPEQFQQNCLSTEGFPDVEMCRRFKNAARDIHHIIGMCTEIGELQDAYKKYLIYGQPLNLSNVAEEIGDLLYYIAGLCNTHGWSMSKIMQENADKLAKRYPEGFSEQAAKERKDKNDGC